MMMDSNIMALISRVLSNKYIRSELFRHVSLIHRQLGIKVFQSSDIVSLYHCVRIRDTAKFIRHCDQLDISIHSPQDLLDTINNAYYNALIMQNDRLVTYIIERFRRGSNTTKDKFVEYVRKSFFNFIGTIDHLKLSRPMIHALINYLPDVAPLTIVHFMMKSVWQDHGDYDLLTSISSFLGSRSPPCIDRCIVFGYKMDYNPLFTRHQSRIIDDLHHYLKSHQPTDYNIATSILVDFASKHRLYDLLIMIANHVVHNEDRQMMLCLSPLEQPLCLESLVKLETSSPPLFNRLASGGDISFMKHVQHLMPEYLYWLDHELPNKTLYDLELLQCALSGGHYECALYILDNITPALRPDVVRFERPKWIVSGINMSNNHNWIDLIETLIKHDNVELSTRSLTLYSDAIKARRLDVIEHLEQMIRDPNSLIGIDIDKALNVALKVQYVDAIKTIIHNRPGHVYHGIKLYLIDQCTPEIQDMFLASVHPSQSIDLDIFGLPRQEFIPANISANTIRMFIKHEHHPNCWWTLLRSADLLNERELIDILSTHGPGTSPYIGDPWRFGDESIKYQLSEFDPDTHQDQMVYILHNERHWTRIDSLLATQKHLSRPGATLGRLIESDVLALFNLLPPQPFDTFVFEYQADVSRLDIDRIEFIWSKLSDTIKRDQNYINDVLSSYAAINNITMYQYVLDYLIKDNHFQDAFISAPTIKQIKDNIQQYRRYSSIRLIVELFNPLRFIDQSSTTSPYQRLLIPLTTSEFQQYQSLLINLGVFNPPPSIH
ncbi:hypothetical protein SAMD00019534_092980, partial [Acytostelium subglobosum LB1]|uniref:hypothetical protein n=1 Tax=Acytostelium subglobosum LB1 TaxID=1410327 RepID=UPI000644D4B7